MELLSHFQPIIDKESANQAEVGSLVEAFTQFIAASTKLEASYAQLQAEVAYLNQELTARNTALKVSLTENERVHLALRSIVDAMPCGVIVVESDGAVSMINPEAGRLLNIGGSSIADLHAISVKAGIDLLNLISVSSPSNREQEFRQVTPHGERWFSVKERCLPKGDERGTVGRKQTILILRDITQQKQVEAERESAQRASALAEVAMMLAHEIRNPLASLELFVELIAAGGEDTSEWVSHLHAGVRSLSGTVNNVLSFHGAGFPSMAPVDLRDAIRSSVEFVRPLADQAGISLTFDAGSPAVWVNGSCSALQQLVLNVVSNSLRHTAEGGNVRVSVRCGGNSHDPKETIGLIEFSDTGCGIAEQDLGEIFRAGFSANGNTCGLGLAVCEQIVRQHEGSIRVVSTVGVGTTLYVELPIL